MANRHLSRSIVMQSLFEWDFNITGGKKPDLEEILKRNVEEFAPGGGDTPFMEDLLKNIVSKQAILDEIIEKAAPEWPIERISVVDRNVLRIGLYELLFGDRADVPPKVAINEAIELAKTFGGENSGKFVNGVLGAVYKELGEPGKDDVSKKKNNNKVDVSKLPVERLGGAIIYSSHDGQYYLAFVHDIFGHWTLSKGHIEESEEDTVGTARKVREEIGIDIEIKEKIGENEYLASKPEKGKIRKHVSYFLAEAKYGPLKLEEGKGGLDDCKWFPITEVPNLNIYDDILPIITKAIQLLISNK